MKLLVVINSLEKGGAEKLLVNTLPFLKDKNIDISLIILSGINSESTYINNLLQNNIRIIDLKCNNIYNFNIIFKIRQIIKEINPHIIHVHLFPSMYWVALAQYKLKKTSIFTEHSTKNNRLNIWFFKYVDKYIYHQYKNIICISNDVQKILINRYNLKNTIVLENGVDLNLIKNSEIYNRNSFLKDLNIRDNSSLLILFTARLEKPKRHDIAIKSLKYLPKNYHYLFAGDGNLEENLRDLCVAENVINRVHFLGFRNDIPNLINSVDLNVLISDYEGLSGVALESLASNVPFLGSDVSGINNVVPDSNYLFDNNEIDVANKILGLLQSNKTAQDSVILSNRHVKKFDLTYMVESLYNLYNNLKK